MAKIDLIKYFLCLGTTLCMLAAGEDFFPTASDPTWVSFNFKTILTWGPKPSNYSYTVEFSQLGEDRLRNPHCIQSSATDCDLTNDLYPLKNTYTADILSGPLRGRTTDLVEFPFTRAPRFNPYTDTQIGKAEFRLEVTENKAGMRVLISDPLTPIRKDGRLLTIRDVFKQDLQYKIRYNKAGSTGKREMVSGLSQVEVKGLDQGESYCFSIAAYISSRPADRRLGEWTRLQCSPREHKGILHDLSFEVMVAGVFILVALLILVIVLLVLCCRHCGCWKKTKTSSTENLDMTHV